VVFGESKKLIVTGEKFPCVLPALLEYALYPDVALIEEPLVPTNKLVEFLTKLKDKGPPIQVSPDTTIETVIKILLLELVGVMLSDIPVISTIELDVEVKASLLVACITCTGTCPFPLRVTGMV
jgi:CBS domain-containing protein